MHFLAIETSCDETAAAVLSEEDRHIKILSNVISSQVKLHSRWGGVVPNLAARQHAKNIGPVVKKSLGEAGVQMEDIGVIAVTQGPGLIPALMVGVDAAKTLSYLWKKPLIGIHHIEGHIYANFIKDKISVSTKSQIPNPKQIQNSKKQTSEPVIESDKLTKLKADSSGINFPILCLVVSGGHTQLVLMRDHLRYEIIGQTLDDAAGEAFDKVARMLGLGYPGGPAVAETATEFKVKNEKLKITFPRPMLHSDDFNFSFSGLKTAVLYKTKELQEQLPVADYQLLIPEICREFQQAAIDVLISKTIKAAKKFNTRKIMIAGGVSANQELRRQLGEKIKQELPDAEYETPDVKYSIDNAAMIGAAASFRWQRMTDAEKENALMNWKSLQADANLKLK